MTYHLKVLCAHVPVFRRERSRDYLAALAQTLWLGHVFCAALRTSSVLRGINALVVSVSVLLNLDYFDAVVNIGCLNTR